MKNFRDHSGIIFEKKLVHILFTEVEEELKESQSKRSIKFKDEAEKALDEEVKSSTGGFKDKIDFPQFGTSPGPSPTPSPPSTPQTPSYFSVSEVSSTM